MKVGFFLLHPFWESMASGVRTLELAKSLKKLDVEPIIFSLYEESRVTEEGVQIVKVPTIFSSLGIEDTVYYASRRLYYNRALQKLVIKSSKKLLNGRIQLSSKLDKFFKQFDLDLLQAEQDNAALSLLSIRSKLDFPLVLDLHGIWPEELLAAHAIQVGSKDWKALQDIMRQIVKSVDLTVCLSDAMREYVLSNYDAEQRRTVVVPPGGRILFDEYVERPFPQKVVYAGIVSYRKHVDLFVKSMSFIKNVRSDVEFYITKRGDLLEQIQNLACRLRVEPNYFWFSDFEAMLKFLASCHIGVHPSTNDMSARLSMPSKLFDYLSMGLPVVANDVGGWTDILKKYKVGLVTENNPSDFSKGIIEFLDSPDKMADYGKRGIDLIKKIYNWDVSAKIMFDEYLKILH